MSAHQAFTLVKRALAPMLVMFSACFVGQSMAGQYAAQRISSLGGSLTIASGVNSTGQVVGTSYLPGDLVSRAFITGPNGLGVTALGTLGGESSYGAAINNRGQVAGYALVAPFEIRAFTTGPNGTPMTNLGVFGQGNVSRAAAINSYGQVAGWSLAQFAGDRRAFITDLASGDLVDIGSIGESPSALRGNVFATGINSAGQVVGYGSVALPRTGPGMTRYSVHAFITNPGGVGIRDLGPADGPHSWAYGINDFGQVVGRSADQAFRTAPNGEGLQTLGTLGGTESEALAINNEGVVVGRSLTSNGAWHAFVFGASGDSMIDLNNLIALDGGDYFIAATAISDNGSIVANTLLGAAYLISPIPEVSSAAMFLFGILIVCRLAWRRAPGDA